MPTTAKHTDLLRTMYRIRFFEDRLKEFYDYTGFYGEGTVAGDAATTEDMLTCVMYDFEITGSIGGAVHVYIGEEAVATGVCGALKQGDFVTSPHRGHGHAIAMGLDLGRVLAELMGREAGYSRGCGGSMHIFSVEDGVLGGNGIVGAGIPIALGPAFAAKYLGKDGVCVGFFGDGASNQGTFHEAMNMAALWKLPVIYVCENNLWAATTPAEIALCTPDIADRAQAYGIPGVVVDGMDVAAVHNAAVEAVARARAGEGPTLIEAKTFRFEGHAGAGKGSHQDFEAVQEWRQRDPIPRLEQQLIGAGVMTAAQQQAVQAEIREEVEQAIGFAKECPFPTVDLLEATELPSANADCGLRIADRTARPGEPREGALPSDVVANQREISYAQAVSEALREEMEHDESVFLIGEDLGPVRTRDGLWDQFRERRVWQTPISESGFVGLGVGAAAAGLRPVVDIMYCDFVTVCFDQIVNQAAKLRLMSGNKLHVPMVIKTPAGCGTREGGHHSGSHEAWFMHAPGLKVVMPADAYDAKGLLKSAIRDDEPVVFIQHRRLHRMTQRVPEGEWLVPLGEAAIKREGTDLTVVATSYAVPKALRAAEALAGEISLEIIDPRTLVPLDVETIAQSVRKTGKLLIVHEAPARSGAGAEILRQVLPQVFGHLRTSPRVLGGADVAMPYSPPLEDACIPQPADIARVAREMARG
ncbi:MAG: dehydrogenase [Armatimonadetes bacterium CG17_big_fil_post_rev_8_21_14_2_50_66_6]|nr:MAG: dehydrogenase [Armatimonadetes bacterium CG17_big_fil_post_rev_8_21_14_2_50_66_6]